MSSQKIYFICKAAEKKLIFFVCNKLAKFASHSNTIVIFSKHHTHTHYIMTAYAFSKNENAAGCSFSYHKPWFSIFLGQRNPTVFTTAISNNNNRELAKRSQSHTTCGEVYPRKKTIGFHFWYVCSLNGKRMDLLLAVGL